MSDDTPIDDGFTHTADPNDPEAIAREAVEAMRARGPLDSAIERAILGAGRRTADFMTRVGWPKDAEAQEKP